MSEYQLATLSNISNQTSGVGASGYTCPTCQCWVTHGTYHTCNTWTNPWWNYQQPITTYYPIYYQAQPSVQKFRGSVKTMKDLPSARQARVGDSYYVKDAEALVVRVPNGWHTFDGDGS